MAHTTTADRAQGLLVIRYEPPVDAEELLAVTAELDKGDLPTTCPRRLHDLRGWGVDMSTEDLRRVADGVHAQRRRQSPEARMARQIALLVSTDLTFGLARMLEVLVADRERKRPLVRAFRSFADATTWLGLPTDYPDPRDAAGADRREPARADPAR